MMASDTVYTEQKLVIKTVITIPCFKGQKALPFMLESNGVVMNNRKNIQRYLFL